MTVTLQQAQADLAGLIRRLAPGAEIAVTDGDRVVARIVGDRRPLQPRPGPGLGKGMLTVVADDDGHLAAFAEYMP